MPEGGILVDATAPLTRVVDEIVAHLTGHGRSGTQ